MTTKSLWTEGDTPSNNTATAWALFDGNTYFPAYTHETKRAVIEDCIQNYGYNNWNEAQKAGCLARKITVSWEDEQEQSQPTTTMTKTDKYRLDVMKAAFECKKISICAKGGLGHWSKPLENKHFWDWINFNYKVAEEPVQESGSSKEVDDEGDVLPFDPNPLSPCITKVTVGKVTYVKHTKTEWRKEK
jgi:hypothetical protein